MTTTRQHDDRRFLSAIALYPTIALRQIESSACDQPLMQRAGLAAADYAEKIRSDRTGAVLVLAGPGNNGGDAFECASVLRERLHEVRVVFPGNPKDLPLEAGEAFERFIRSGGTIDRDILPESPWSILIDGIFGIGLKREVTEPYASLIRKANQLALRDNCPLLALDCPSGLDADTGKRCGVTIHASHTLTFIGGKPGLFMADGPDFCGHIVIARLGLENISTKVPCGRAIAPELFKTHLRPRLRNSHKGSNGSVGIIGGTAGMTGAALLCARAALQLGSGRIYTGLIDQNARTVDPFQPELMMDAPETVLSRQVNVLTCGPGMGQCPRARHFLVEGCAHKAALILDADALNLIASDHDLQVLLASRSAPTILTPHPAEAARLLGCDTASIQADRLGAAQELSLRYNAHVAVKGCGTVVCTPAGAWFINISGNPGLATAGSGDVLSGFIAALIAQNWPVCEALLAAIHLHGTAADDLVAEGHGPIGLTAGELINAARYRLNRWISDHPAL